ncbi:MAG TPA: tRNA pseudouridine(13) synthase TruD [Gemmatales bacterium]|nr:tRNA pseudouridine(13) synthase TruD [Gemmatales bacterium]
MKLKSRPDDFQVEEVTSVVAGTTGPYAFYRLSKKSVGTPEAIQRVCRELDVDPRRVRYGGLKDRHAETIQYLTIDEGPERHIKDPLIQMKYLGRVEEPYGPQSFSGNRFGITMRDIEPAALERTMQALEEVRHGVIGNYFDDQRFGSVGDDQQFVARALIDGDDEKALKLAISTWYEQDRSQEKKAKALLRKHWGHWQKVRDKMPKGFMSHIVSHLANQSDDFRGAFVLIPFFQRNMYLSAYQSSLWNRILSDWMMTTLPPVSLVVVKQQRHSIPMPGPLTKERIAELIKMTIPLPSSRAEVPTGHPIKSSLDKVLTEEGLHLSQIKLKHYREPFFSKGDRPAFYAPEGLQHELGWDKLNKGHRKLRLTFTLPRGSYATLLIKRISTASPLNENTSLGLSV